MVDSKYSGKMRSPYAASTPEMGVKIKELEGDFSAMAKTCKRSISNHAKHLVTTYDGHMEKTRDNHYMRTISSLPKWMSRKTSRRKRTSRTCHINNKRCENDKQIIGLKFNQL